MIPFGTIYKQRGLYLRIFALELDNEIKQTAAFANPQNGVLSMAFLNSVNLRDGVTGS